MQVQAELKEERREWWRRGPAADVAVALLLLLLCALFFWPVLTPDAADRRWFAAGDFTDQFYAFRAYMARELWSGRLPLWNPYTYSGSPFLADVQAAVFYPPGLITVLLGGPELPLLAVELEVITHYFLAGFFLYLLVRDLAGPRGGRVAGLVSAVVYAFGSYLTSYPKLQMAILEGQTWVPLALLAVHRAAGRVGEGQRGRAAAWLALGGLALGLAVLAGHAQTTLLAGYTVLAYLLFRFWPLWRRGPKRDRLALAGLLAILPVVALGIGAAQLVPSLEYVRLSTRAAISYQRAGGGFVPSDLLALILPGLRVIYVGVLPLILAILAVVLKKSRETVFWAAVAVVALILSLGRTTVLYTIFYLLLPGYDLFQGQERTLQVFGLAVAILAGLGTAVLARPMDRRTKHRYAAVYRLLVWAGVGSVALALLAYAGSLSLAQQEPGQVSDLLERSVLLAMLLGFCLLVLGYRLGHRLRPGHLVLLLLPLIVFDLFTVNQGHDLERARARDRFAVTPLVRYLQEQPGNWRLWDDGLLLPGNAGMMWDVEEAWGISPLRLQRYQDMRDDLPGHLLRWLLNVHYAVSSQHELPDGELLAEFSRPDDDFYVYRIRQPGPRVAMVYDVEVQPDDTLARRRLAAPDFDPARTAILAQEPGIAPAGSGQGTARLVERQPDRLVVEVDTPADGILLLSEIDYPGWRARVDGQEVPILRANTIQRAVALGAGSHRVEMVFRPWTATAGIAVAALTLILVLAGIALAAGRRRRAR